MTPERLRFRTGTASSNPPAAFVHVWNVGGGVFTPTVSTSTPWLSAAVLRGRVQVAVDKTGLPHGHYTGTVTIYGQPSACVQGSPWTVSVDLFLYEGAVFPYRLYLPLVARQR